MRKTSKVVAGETGKAIEYNNLRDEARGSSFLMAYADTTTTTLKVLVNEGNVYFGSTIVEFTGGYSPEITDTAQSSRIDVLTINSSGTLEITEGTEADSPTTPDIPAGKIPICSIYMRNGATQITDEDDSSNGYIYNDLRQFINLKPEFKYRGFSASNNLRHSNDTERSTASSSYTKVKECLLLEDISACRIKFTIRELINGQTAYGRIYKNGVAIGTERSTTSNTGEEFSEDFTNLVAGDLIQIYIKKSVTGNTAYAKNFRFYWDNILQITKIENLELATPIDTTTSYLVSITNQD